MRNHRDARCGLTHFEKCRCYDYTPHRPARISDDPSKVWNSSEKVGVVPLRAVLLMRRNAPHRMKWIHSRSREWVLPRNLGG